MVSSLEWPRVEYMRTRHIFSFQCLSVDRYYLQESHLIESENVYLLLRFHIFLVYIKSLKGSQLISNIKICHHAWWSDLLGWTCVQNDNNDRLWKEDHKKVFLALRRIYSNKEVCYLPQNEYFNMKENTLSLSLWNLVIV